MGLLISRRVGECFELYIEPGTDINALAEELTQGISIRIHEVDTKKRKAWIDIIAPRTVCIVRSEVDRRKDQPDS